MMGDVAVSASRETFILISEPAFRVLNHFPRDLDCAFCSSIRSSILVDP